MAESQSGTIFMEMEANKAEQQLDSIFDDEGHFDNGTPIWNFEN